MSEMSVVRPFGHHPGWASYARLVAVALGVAGAVGVPAIGGCSSEISGERFQTDRVTFFVNVEKGVRPESWRVSVTVEVVLPSW